MIGHRGEEEYRILDDAFVLVFFAENSAKDISEYVKAVLGKVDFWGCDLCGIAGVEEAVTGYLSEIRALGMRGALTQLLGSSQM